MTRVVAVSAGTLALVACLLLGVTGGLPAAAVQALARMGAPDYVNDGVRIVPPSAVTSSPEEEEEEEEDEGSGKPGGGMTKTSFDGDEVSPALATYGIDRDGNLFEVHSPHTEVPRLPGPTI